MSNLPEEVRKELRGLISRKTDETIDLVSNLVGRKISEEKRTELKREFELKEVPKIENQILKAYQIGLQLQEEFQHGEFETCSVKERFYLMTDIFLKPSIPKLPTSVHALDYLFKNLEVFLSDFRFSWSYLKDTRYGEHLETLRKLMNELKRENKISKAGAILSEFRNSNDFYLLLQATLQKLIKYYQFLEDDTVQIEKKQIDKYLEIYEELAGHYEKLTALITALIQLLETSNDSKYEIARRRNLYQNMLYIEKSRWRVFILGFNRNIRNAIVHKTVNIDIVKRRVKFVDRSKTVTLTFKEVQEQSRELGSLLLVLPHVFISIFCLIFLSIKEILDSFSD